jgi:LysM repeat protein
MADEEPRRCRFCAEDATQTCGRCGRDFCSAHGRGGLCRECLAPAGALPTQRLYWGSLVALGIAAFAGIWVLFLPPSLPGEHRLAHSSAQNPSAVQPVRSTVSLSSGVPTPLPGSVASPTAPALRSYTVVLNDTLSGIAESFGTTVAAIEAANPGVNQSNLKAGQELLIPPPGVTPTPVLSPSPSPTPSTPTPSTPTPTGTPAG